jgi:tripartite-type tricarboxylate transporter receptor subunit TctC
LRGAKGEGDEAVPSTIAWKNDMRLVLAAALAATALLGAQAGSALAQDAAYPSRPVKIIVAFPAGGLLDTVSRIVGDKLSVVLGQQFLIESRPGAGGTLATAAVARAKPDGYTLMMINDNHAVNPSVFKNIPYDSVKDFAPIGFVGSAPMALSANARLAVRTVDDLVRLARPARSRMDRWGSAARAILPASCSPPRPASACCTFRSAAARRPSTTSSPDMSTPCS